MLAERIKVLDIGIQTKISENYNAVRKAFLDMDRDFDGLLTAEDFLHSFANKKLGY